MMQASAGATELFVWKMIPGLILYPKSSSSFLSTSQLKTSRISCPAVKEMPAA